MSNHDITIGSSQVDLGSTFREEAELRIRTVAKKYLGDLTTASVHVTRDGSAYRCSVKVQMGANAPMSGEASANDVPLSFKAAFDKVEKQLRRTKRFLREDKAHRLDKEAFA